MDVHPDSLERQRDFHHPYQPYDIQVDFMNAVYNCIERGKVGILESPTGTGKSLSLICGAATWLRNFQRRRFDAEIDRGLDDDQLEPDWLVAGMRKQMYQDMLRRRKQHQDRLEQIRLKEAKARARYESGEPANKRQKIATKSQGATPIDESDFLLKDYESEDEKVVSSNSKSGLSAETQALLDKVGLSEHQPSRQDETELDDETKIYFCSRTHSQLSQFANEIRRVQIPAPIMDDIDEYDDDDESSEQSKVVEALKHVTLGSRKQLCINPKVSKLGHAGAITERCLELQQSGTSSESRCPYLPTKETEVLVNDFRDHAMAKIRDIEDFGVLGEKLGICPYYATRAAVKPSEIVTVPYPLLLQKSAREALGISLKGHVVMIDEAHNLMDSISNIHSVSVTLAQLQKSRTQLATYLQKFHKKLKGKNRVYVTQLTRLIDSLTECIRPRNDDSTFDEIQVQIADLLKGKGVDQINLYKLMTYLQESKLARKVERYLVHTATGDANSSALSFQSTATSPAPVLNHVQSFLQALTNPAAEGHFFIAKVEGDIDLRYILLDPTHHFKEIVDEARAVILAGGTMSPMSDFTNHLFHYLPQERIDTLSCGHIIPPSSLLALPVTKGPGAVDFDFTFEKRNSHSMIRSLGLAILRLARSIPDGLVIFFPSHAYLNKAVEFWQKATDSEANSADPSIWTRLNQTKRIFLEPKSTASVQQPSLENPVSHEQESQNSRSGKRGPKSSKSGTVDQLLSEYNSCIQSHSSSGALLFAVIGGSLSEGINFSDSLGRGIVVVGLPFPNAQSAEWKAKLEYVKQRSRKEEDYRSSPARVVKNDPAKEYYENTCMRAVNQSVGRAIRHKEDYAAIFLFDKRYERTNIREKLPAWIKRSLQGAKGRFEDIEWEVTEFFRTKGDSLR